jgi:hypothetical protein
MDNVVETESAEKARRNKAHIKDLPALRRARARFSVKSKDKSLDLVFRYRIVSMWAALNFYLDAELNFTWRESSILAARAQGYGEKRACNIRNWIHHFLSTDNLPLHRYGTVSASLLSDEDFSHGLQLHLLEVSGRNGYIRAEDVAGYVALQEVQDQLGPKKRVISLRTAQRWLGQLEWRYGKPRRGMFVDGHERDDVVEYRKDFVRQWSEYEKRMVTYDNNGDVFSTPTGFPVPQGPRFQLHLITHDESIFTANDRRKTKWTHEELDSNPERKGEGASVMVSDFLVPEWGRLKDEDGE